MSGTTKSGRLGKAKKKPVQVQNKNLNIAPPKYLRGEALKYWKKGIKLLIERQTFTDADYEAFEMLAVSFGQWKDISKELSANGMTYETTTDRGAMVIREHPSVKTMFALCKVVDSYQKKFGLNPLDRSAIKQSKKPISSIRDRYKNFEI